MKIIYLYIAILIGTFFSACSFEETLQVYPGNFEEEELPIEFYISLAGEETSGTRAIENPKTMFNEGDIIHIQGTFQTKINDQDTEVVRYGALRKVKNGWDTVPGNKLKWPNMATSGSFVAYWVNGSNGLLLTSSPITTNLSDLKSDTDPLWAKSAENIAYGRGVQLDFYHLCTYLTLEELEPMVSNSYWITSIPENNQSINNAYRLSLNRDNTLSFEFLAVPNPEYNNLVYVEGEAINEETSSEGELTTFTTASFFLEPGTYDSFMIRYPGVAPESYEFLKYDFNNLPVNDGSEGQVEPKLEPGKTYILNVTKSPGITIVAPPSAEGWDESDLFYEVDVEKFLDAANRGDDYEENDVLILQRTASGVKLLHNVDFQYEDYNGIFENFEANIDEGQVFDGGYHYIKNIASPVFRYNNGTIKDLGLKSINAIFVTDENDDSGHDLSRMGLLCQWNRQQSQIQNIRIPDGAAITAMVKQDLNANPEDETHNIGVLTGSNTGYISDIELGGEFNMTVTGFYTEISPTPMTIDITVLIGGIVGQNTYSISNVTASDNNLELNIFNNCTGTYGAFYTGGIAGQSTGYTIDVMLPTVNVDCSKSEGQTLYTGGMFGESTTTSTTTTQTGIENCVLSGDVKAGIALANNSDTGSAVYTGGIAGALQNSPVTGCRVGTNIYGPSESNNNVVYATGGLFGRIRTVTEVSNLIGYGNILQGVPYIGNFAGIVPDDLTWSDYADKNITVRQFTGIKNIGNSESIITD